MQLLMKLIKYSCDILTDMTKGKIIDFPTRIIGRHLEPGPAGASPTSEQFCRMKVDLFSQESVASALMALSYRHEDSIQTQDLKSTVIRRVSMEALSRSWVELKDVNTRSLDDRRHYFNLSQRFLICCSGSTRSHKWISMRTASRTRIW